MIGLKRKPPIDAEAADWVARRDRGALDPRAEAAFAAWLAADRRHLGAYARAEAVLLTFDRVRALRAPGVPPALRPRVASRRALLGWGSGAAVAAVLASIVLVPAPPQRPGERYANAIGELRRVALTDGSRMTLGTGAETIVRLEGEGRQVALVRGPALFDVASDARRPFVVTAGDVSVTALGTSFSVDYGKAGGTVLVRHGSVAVRRGGRPSLARAGWRVTWGAAASSRVEVAAVDEQELRRELAWTQGMLAFEARTMAEATAEFARHSDFRIVIADPRLARRKITGWFSIRDPRGFAHAAAASLGAVAEDEDNAVIIRPAS